MDDRLAELIQHTKTEEFQQRIRARRENERDKARPMRAKLAAKYRRRAENKIKLAARQAVKAATYDGRLNPANAQCAMRDSDGWVIKCSGYIQAHHWHGYDEPHWLDVQWLCRHHHRIADKDQAAISS